MKLLVIFLIIFLSFTNGIEPDNVIPTVASLNSAVQRSEQARTKDLKREESRLDDPTPEYYRGPTSVTINGNRDRDRRYGYSRPDPIEHRYNGDNFVTNRYIPQTTSSYGVLNRDRDRFGGGSSYGSYGNSYQTNVGYNPYSSIPPLPISPPTRNPYGYPPRPINYPTSYGYGGSSYDIRDNHLGNGLDWGENGYGSDYEYDHWNDKFGLTKSNLLPIAGAALLGIAAALVANPVLLQLGVLPGKRKKRDISTGTTTVDDNQKAQKLAYKGHLKR